MLRLLSMLAVLVLLIAGCGKGDPVQPGISGDAAQETAGMSLGESGSHHCLLGYWEISGDIERNSLEVVPIRGAALHVNIVKPVETTWPKSYLTLETVYPLGNNQYSVGVSLKHPYPENLHYCGFDVRGIFISTADTNFPASGARMALGDDVARMLTFDGYTRIFNPSEYPEGSPFPSLLKYTRGNLARGWHLTSTVNPYYAFARELPRRIFRPSYSETMNVTIQVPATMFHFGYALDASWAQYIPPITDPVAQFPPEANSPEAYRIEMRTGRELAPSLGSSTLLGVEVYDREGADTIGGVAVEAPELSTGLLQLAYIEPVGPDRYLFTTDLVNGLGAGYGEYNVLVRVADKVKDPNLGSLEAWDLGSVRIKRGWGRTYANDPEYVGDSTPDSYGAGLDVDSSGNMYIAGSFAHKADFDPGPEYDWHECPDLYSTHANLVRFDSRGGYLGGLSWGGDGGYQFVRAGGVGPDGSGNVYVTGTFNGLVDFDPGAGAVEVDAGQSTYAYLTKFTVDGSFQWVRTWGPVWPSDQRLEVSGNIYIVGQFNTVSDFNPDPSEEDWLSPVGLPDAYITCIDPTGDYVWARNWGTAEAKDVAVDGSGGVYVVGSFKDTVDFDPGDGVENRASNGARDIYVSKLDVAGNFKWVRTWGGSIDNTWYFYDGGEAVAVDSEGSIWVGGCFVGSADFDPGPGEFILTSVSAYSDAFLSKLDSAGEFVWAGNWGGDSGSSWGNVTCDVCAEPDGNVLVTGRTIGTCDFDPGPGIDEHTCAWYGSAFLSKFTSSGGYLWGRHWGGTGSGYGVASDNEGGISMCGEVRGLVDLDAGDGEDFWPTGSLLMHLPPDGNY